ncbi:CCA tRNA nucleotidyltransferase, partial [Bacillus safensis]|nr:CCA tRNA nucleotidyltransferase [Bacillus safensis]
DGRQVIDLFGGREDLQAGVIRCVGDPDTRLEEDALHLLRGLRLAAQLSFALEASTAAAIRRHAPQLSLVAWERIWGEFSRLICAPGAEEVLL